jgi:DNA-binding transcriptional LysR family regulator
MKPASEGDRLRRLAAMWSWLPAFRAVGETAHLPTAAALLGSSGPALSRAVRLLEDAIGERLFDRVGRRLVLNDAGGALLLALRQGMRQLDDALDGLTGLELAGIVRLAAWDAHLPIVLPALRALRAVHPAIAVQVSRAAPTRGAAQLLDGSLDLVLGDAPLAHPEVEGVALGAMRYAVYAGPGHPLHRRRVARVTEVARYGFVAPSTGLEDRWPSELARDVRLRLASIHETATVCGDGELLAVLPESLAAAAPARLRRLAAPAIAPVPIVALHRRRLGSQPRLDALLRELRAVARRVERA